jgi:hypothetical protein
VAGQRCVRLAEASRPRAQQRGAERRGEPAAERQQVERLEQPRYGCSSATITCRIWDQGRKIWLSTDSTSPS